jgi:Putative restriction endonuclease
MARAVLEEDWPRTVAEFQEWHAREPERWEFVDGRPRLMAPASMTHSILKRNALRTLDRALADSGCEVLVDGPQILTDEISAIPDVIVTCAPMDLSTPVVAEPTIIVEVMSPSSEADDTLRKWFSYRRDREPEALSRARTGPAPGSDPQPRGRPLARALRERRSDRARRSAPSHGDRRPLRRDRAGGVGPRASLRSLARPDSGRSGREWIVGSGGRSPGPPHAPPGLIPGTRNLDPSGTLPVTPGLDPGVQPGCPDQAGA